MSTQRGVLLLAASWFGLALLICARVEAGSQIDRLRAQLRAADVEQAVAAARSLSGISKSNAVARRAVADALRLGGPPPVVIALLRGLATPQARAELALLRHYAGHRNVAIRATATHAVGAIPGEEAAAVLLRALGDSDSRVRERAAALLAERRWRAAVPRLLALLERGDSGAAVPVAQLGGASVARALIGSVGALSEDVVARAMGEMLLRADFGPDPIRLEVVRALATLPGVASTATLVEYVAAVPAHEERPSKAAAEQAIARRQR